MTPYDDTSRAAFARHPIDAAAENAGWGRFRQAASAENAGWGRFRQAASAENAGWGRFRQAASAESAGWGRFRQAASAWQESWDRQQEAFLPDREERFSSMLDTVAAVSGGDWPRILDLAGGTGSISLRVLRRFPQAHTTLVDVDPVLLAIARASLDERAVVVSADLRTPSWVDALAERDFDAVLTSTALHWLPLERLAALYAEVRQLLRPGGVLINADHMPDGGLPGLNAKLGDRERAHRESRYAAGAVLSWEAWWDHVAKDTALGPLVQRRREVFADRHGDESTPDVSWHLDALRQAGYAEVGITWRGGRDAAVTAVR